MDLRAYYRKLRGVEAELREESVVVISRETSDGGRAGVKSDVPRALAARLLVDEKADLATPEEAADFRAEVEAKWKGGHGSLPWVTQNPAREPACRPLVNDDWRPHIDGRGSVAETSSGASETDCVTANTPDEKS